MARRPPRTLRVELGSIVYFGVFDQRFNNYKKRPVLIMSDDDGSGTFDGLAITTRFDLAPVEEQVAIVDPWTGLKEPSAVVCTWPVEVDSTRMDPCGKVTRANLEQVLQRVHDLRLKGVIKSD